MCPKPFRKDLISGISLFFREKSLSNHLQYIKFSEQPVQNWNDLFLQIFPMITTKHSIAWMNHTKFEQFYIRYFKALKKHKMLNNDLWILFKLMDCFPCSLGVQALWDKKKVKDGNSHNGYVVRIVRKKEQNY